MVDVDIFVRPQEILIEVYRPLEVVLNQMEYFRLLIALPLALAIVSQPEKERKKDELKEYFEKQKERFISRTMNIIGNDIDKSVLRDAYLVPDIRNFTAKSSVRQEYRA